MFIDPATGAIESSSVTLGEVTSNHKLEDAESKIKELEHRLAEYEKVFSALITLDLDVSRFASLISRTACSNCRSDVDTSVCDNLYFLDLLLEIYNADQE